MRKHFSIGVFSALAASLCVAQAAQAQTATFNDIPFAGSYGFFSNDLWDAGLHFQDDSFAIMPVNLSPIPSGQASTFMEAGNYSMVEPLTLSHYTGMAPSNDGLWPAGPDYQDSQAFNLWYLKIGLGAGNKGLTDTVTINGISAAGCTIACNPTMTVDVTSHFLLVALEGFTDLTSVTISQQLKGDNTRDSGWLGFDDFSYTPFAATGDNPRPDPPPPVPAANVPEPGAWALMIVGFGGVGALMRRNRRAALAAA
ncbi:MAG: PEPxxWA-CTERM sorting domain-containing protein [Phenylobacterium sp.]